VRAQGAQVLADDGKLTVRRTRDITVPVTFTHLPDKLGARSATRRSKATCWCCARPSINHNDFGIKAGEMTDKVAETIHLSRRASPRRAAPCRTEAIKGERLDLGPLTRGPPIRTSWINPFRVSVISPWVGKMFVSLPSSRCHADRFGGGLRAIVDIS
jgi:hypothetical protein